METKLRQGPISQNELINNLVNAKKIMKKVDDGTFSKGFIDESKIVTSSEDNIIPFDPKVLNQNPTSNNNQVIEQVNIEKIQSSKLPDAIKKAMIENPIPQLKLNDGLDMSLIKNVKRIIENEGVATKKVQSQQQRVVQSSGDLVRQLEPIIENIVRKTITEILDIKLTQILTAQKTMSINENLVIKVGNSVFQGKITKVNSSKK